MKESQIRSKLIKLLNINRCAAWPVENAVAVGMPDVYGNYSGQSFWIELKRIKAKLKPDVTLDDIKDYLCKHNAASWKRQFLWASRFSLHGGVNVFLLCVDNAGVKFFFPMTNTDRVCSSFLSRIINTL